MGASEPKPNNLERPRNVDVVTVDLLGRPIEFSVVHSWHFIENKPEEVLAASALFLEGPLSSIATLEPASFVNNWQYRRLAQLAISPQTPLPIIFIDAELTPQDVIKIGSEQAAEATVVAATGFLTYRGFVNAARNLKRRAFLQLAGASALSLHPLTSLLSTLADYRPSAKSGEAARRLSELSELNPLHPRITLALRNRIFAFKSILAAKFLLNGIPDDPIWNPLPGDRIPRFPLIVGGTHTDVARHLRRDPNELWREIGEISRSSGVSDKFLASAFRVTIAKYDSPRGGWHIITVVDSQAQRKSNSPAL